MAYCFVIDMNSTNITIYAWMGGKCKRGCYVELIDIMFLFIILCIVLFILVRYVLLYIFKRYSVPVEHVECDVKLVDL